jgi:TRAP-type transport system periplasmic protein
MKGRFVLAFAALIVPALTVGARAEDPIVLKLSSTAPATSPVNINATTPWAEQVNKDAGGTMKIEIFAAGRLASDKNNYDRLVKGVFEIAYGNHGPISGQFPGTEVAALPFLADNSSQASVALWSIANGGPIAGEYKDVKLLTLFVYPQTIIHFRSPVKTLEDLKGMKISTVNRVTSEALQALGAVPISMPNSEIYEAASRGIMQGVALAWSGVRQFKVQEVTTYHLEAPIGASTGFVMMNKEAFDRLPAKAKEALDKNSGVHLAERYGHALDGIVTAQRKQVQGLSGHTIAQLTPAEKARWQERLKPVEDRWVHEVKNGAAILAAYKAALEKADGK